MAKKVAIIGFGREGQSLFKYFPSKDVWILDKNPDIKTPQGVKKQLGKDYLKNLNRFDLVFRSPGVPYNLVSQYKNISSATRLFFEKCPCKIIGVTGTKGKGTTSTLIYNILKRCGKDAYLVGNIGKPALDVLPKLKKDSLVVFELSSFQLQDLKQSPAIAVVLDIFPDHQEVHKNYKEYVEAKKNIYRYQKPNDKLFNIKDIDFKNFTAFSITDLNIPGEHNFKNAVMAYSTTKYLACPVKKIKEAIFSFTGNEHRLEFVSILSGVKYYNDSASTNPQTTLAAVKAFNEPKILITGGYDKNLSYDIWAKEFSVHNVKSVILIGENKKKINETLQKVQGKFETQIVSNLKEAVGSAQKLAKIGNIILFSPGAASFDMFENYADRGDKFKEIVRNL